MVVATDTTAVATLGDRAQAIRIPPEKARITPRGTPLTLIRTLR
jgi:hypothetical protein